MKVQIIPKLQERKKKRVCAYCRVSTKKIHQSTSLESQINYYNHYIDRNPDYENIGIFCDESSGKSIVGRLGFDEMIKLCERGGVDLIITKSISRFSRNTLDAIKMIRLLKSYGVTVFFEKENMNTSKVRSEMILTILTSVAQAEAEQISENIKWSNNKRILEGSYKVSCLPYGYQKSECGEVEINKTEAKAVRYIYKLYLNGYGVSEITNILNSKKSYKPKKSERWSKSSVTGILRNSAYTGDIILQKTYYSRDENKKKVNKGELPKYLVKENHKSIISNEEFTRVQEILNLKNEKFNTLTGNSRNRYPLTNLIKCSHCGESFRRKLINSKKEGERVKWRCKGGCKNSIYETLIYTEFSVMYNKLITNEKAIITNLLSSLCYASEYFSMSSEYNEKQDNMRKLKAQNQALNAIVANGEIDTVLFISKQNEINSEMVRLKTELKYIESNNELVGKINNTKHIQNILKENSKLIYEKNDYLLMNIVKDINVDINGNIQFNLINELKLEGSKKYEKRS